MFHFINNYLIQFRNNNFFERGFMNKIIIKFNIIVISLIVLTSYSSAQIAPITDIIPPVKIEAGKPDTVIISDLFYSKNYDVDLKNSPAVKVNYDNNNQKLVFLPDSNFEGITTVDFTKDNRTYSIPVFGKKVRNHKFIFSSAKHFNSVNLFGSFNGWNRQDLKMTESNNLGTYELTIPMEPGRYEYKYFADGKELIDPLNKDSVVNGMGGFNSIVVIANPHSEKIFLHKINVTSDESNTIYHFYLELSKEIKFNESNIIVLLDNRKIEINEITINGKYIDIKIPKKLSEHAKMLRAAVSINGLNSNLQMIPLNKGIPVDGKTFEWFDGILYSLMIDRFYDANKSNDIPVVHDSLFPKVNYMGGDFEGVTKKINEGYFDSLGVNTIWLSPVVDNPDSAFREYLAPHRWFSGYHGYWPVSPDKVEEKFGTFDDLKNLISTAHKHNIKILLDYVSHHVHKDHPFFRDHKDWFGKLELPDGRLNLRLWDDQRLTTWFEPFLPSFDFIHSDKAVDVISDNALWWITETGADGLRHDAVKHVPNRFWRTLTRKIKSEIKNPSNGAIYQIGETYGNYDLVSSYVNNGQLNSQFNFELFNTALNVFIDPKSSFKDLDRELNKTADVYGSLHLMGNIMDNHDKNRFMAYADGALDLSQQNSIEIGWSNPPEVHNPYNYKKAELFYAYMFSIPGLPVVYYGDEFGMTGASDPDNRRMMRFGNQLTGDEQKMLKVTKQIIKTRDNNTALRYGDFYTLLAEDNIYAFIRSDFYERVLVVLNRTDESQTVNLKLPGIYSISKAVNLITNESYNITGNKLEIPLDARGWAMIKLVSRNE
jgi:cyclomaltodextrinase / maltogenic alpha-amylase / neopullulanase